MLEFIGWLGAVLFACCGAPQAVKTWCTKSCGDLSWTFLGMWWLGEVFTFTYVVVGNYEQGEAVQWPLIVNYVVNFVIVTYLLIVKYRNHYGQGNH